VLRKSPSQALAPLAEIEQLLIPVANRATVADGRLLVRTAALMTQELGEWGKEKAGDDLSELAASRVSQATHNCLSQRTEPSR
jgi:hypothetical protein